MKIKGLIENYINELLGKHGQMYLFNLKAEFLKNTLCTSCEMGVTSEKVIPEDVVVSLTTFGKRLYEVYLTIESIMQGTMKPNRIILWLQDNLKNEELPFTLQKQMKRGLEVRYTKDTRSFKKLIPTLQLCPDSVIITIDDDVLYEIDTIERLVLAYKKDHSHVYGCRVRKIEVDNKGEVMPYSTWKPIYYGTSPSNNNICIGVGGILYPPHCFTNEVFNEEAYTRLCPNADDLWFWMMAKEKGYTSVKVFTHNIGGQDYLVNYNVQDNSLMKGNMGKSGNDIQFKAILNAYQGYNWLKYGK